MPEPYGSATNQSPLFSRQQVGGMFAVVDLPSHPGNIWYVDSTHAKCSDASGYGYNPNAPFATIDYAVAACTASNSDIIYVMPYHSEDIDGAAALALDVIGINVVGLGEGDARPVLDFSDTASTVAVDAADITIRNLRFTQSVDVIVVMIDVNADDFTMIDCEFVEPAAAQAVSLIDVNGGGANACDNFTMIGCRAIQRAAGADQVVDIAVVQDGVKILNCVFDADCENGVVYSPAVLTDVLVRDCIIKNRQAGDHAVEFSAAAIGFIIDNRLFGSTLGTILDPGSCYCAGNLESAAIDTPGIVTPVAITDSAANILGADSADNTFASTNVVRNEDGSIIERLQDVIEDLVGTAGVASFPAAAKAANAVSMAEVLRHIDDAQEQCIVKADGAVLGAADALFDITGGPILVTSFFGIVTTEIGAGASTCQIIEAVTAPAGNVNFSTAVDIDGDVVGASYHMTAATPGVFTPVDVGAFDQYPTNNWFCPIGTINATTSVARAGVIAWYMTYKPLSPTSVVVAAA